MAVVLFPQIGMSITWLVNEFVQFPVVKINNLFDFFFVPYREEQRQHSPAVSAFRAAIEMDAASVYAGRDFRFFCYRNQMLFVIGRILF